jgi:uncharacterized protein (DUF2235 family)
MTSKNIVVYSDGTGQDGGVRPSSESATYTRCTARPVCRLTARSTLPLSGLGTDIGATAMTAPLRFVQKLLSSIDGRGITDNIADCYKFIIDHYQPGDRIVMFGFSRGAMMKKLGVRTVADLVRMAEKAGVSS